MMNEHPTHTLSSRAAAGPRVEHVLGLLLEAAAHGFHRASNWLAEGLQRSRQRRALARLDDRLLRDIGVSRAEAQREARKLFWQR